MVSCTLVKRLRVRRITLGLAAPSSETDQTLAVEDVRDSGETDMSVVVGRKLFTAGADIYTLLDTNQTFRRVSVTCTRLGHLKLARKYIALGTNELA